MSDDLEKKEAKLVKMKRHNKELYNACKHTSFKIGTRNGYWMIGRLIYGSNIWWAFLVEPSRVWWRRDKVMFYDSPLCSSGWSESEFITKVRAELTKIKGWS